MTAIPDHTIDPVVKRRIVSLRPDAAFDLFTRRLGQWWPTATHSIAADEDGEDHVVQVCFETAVGRRVVEVTADGIEHSWADVMAWDPPRRIVLSWHPTVAPVPRPGARPYGVGARADGSLSSTVTPPRLPQLPPPG